MDALIYNAYIVEFLSSLFSQHLRQASSGSVVVIMSLSNPKTASILNFLLCLLEPQSWQQLLHMPSSKYSASAELCPFH